MDDDIEFGEINGAAGALLDMMRSLEYDGSRFDAETAEGA